MPKISRITLFPIKSLDGTHVDEAAVTATGGLFFDRRFAFFDDQDNVVNGKRFPSLHRVRADFDLSAETVHLRNSGESVSTPFHLHSERSELERWMSQHLGFAVRLRERVEGGFPDDTLAPGPTILGAGTCAAVAEWFEGLELDEVRRRFRANVELDCETPFWEDQLYGAVETQVRFRMGELNWLGTNPCQRCVVPSRSSLTGERGNGFVPRFTEKRQATLPDWACRERFDHFYRLAVNTRLVEPSVGGKTIRVGDQVLPEVETNWSPCK